MPPGRRRNAAVSPDVAGGCSGLVAAATVAKMRVGAFLRAGRGPEFGAIRNRSERSASGLPPAERSGPTDHSRLFKMGGAANTGAAVSGRVLARNGAVTMYSNDINVGNCN